MYNYKKIRPLSTRRLVGEDNPYEDENKANKDEDEDGYHIFLYWWLFEI